MAKKATRTTIFSFYEFIHNKELKVEAKTTSKSKQTQRIA
jgi:hypothetical protein